MDEWISKQLEEANRENLRPKHVTAAHCCPLWLGAMGQAVEVS